MCVVHSVGTRPADLSLCCPRVACFQSRGLRGLLPSLRGPARCPVCRAALWCLPEPSPSSQWTQHCGHFLVLLPQRLPAAAAVEIDTTALDAGCGHSADLWQFLKPTTPGTPPPSEARVVPGPERRGIGHGTLWCDVRYVRLTPL